jgi:hypothetical protein
LKADEPLLIWALMPEDDRYLERGKHLRTNVSLELRSDPWAIEFRIQLTELGLAKFSGHPAAEAVPARVRVVADYEWVTFGRALAVATAHRDDGSEDYRPFRDAVNPHGPLSFG